MLTERAYARRVLLGAGVGLAAEAAVPRTVEAQETREINEVLTQLQVALLTRDSETLASAVSEDFYWKFFRDPVKRRYELRFISGQIQALFDRVFEKRPQCLRYRVSQGQLTVLAGEFYGMRYRYDPGSGVALINLRKSKDGLWSLTAVEEIPVSLWNEALRSELDSWDDYPPIVRTSRSLLAKREPIKEEVWLEKAVATVAEALDERDLETIFSLVDFNDFGVGINQTQDSRQMSSQEVRNYLIEAFGGWTVTYHGYEVDTDENGKIERARILLSNMPYSFQRSLGRDWATLGLWLAGSSFRIGGVGEYAGGLGKDFDPAETYLPWASPPRTRMVRGRPTVPRRERIFSEPRTRFVIVPGFTSVVEEGEAGVEESGIFIDLANEARERGMLPGVDFLLASAAGWKINYQTGLFSPNAQTCWDTFSSPQVRGRLLAKLGVEWFFLYPNDTWFIFTHSEGVQPALVAMREWIKALRSNPDFPVKPGKVHFIFTHAPVLGVDKPFLESLAGVIPGVPDDCKIGLGIPAPGTASQRAIEHLLWAWENRREFAREVEANVRFWREQGGKVAAVGNWQDYVLSARFGILPEPLLRALVSLGLAPEILRTQEVPGGENEMMFLGRSHDAVWTKEQGRKALWKIVEKIG